MVNNNTLYTKFVKRLDVIESVPNINFFFFTETYLIVSLYDSADMKCPQYVHLQTWASLMAQLVKNPPATQETPVRFLGQEDPLVKGWTTHSSVLRLPLWLSW